MDSLASLARRRHTNATLIIRLDAIGDFILWLNSGAGGVISTARFENERVVFVISPAVETLVREITRVDEIISISPARFMWDLPYRVKKIREVRRVGARRAIVPRHARVFLQESAIVRASGAQERIAGKARLVNMSEIERSLDAKIFTRVVDWPKHIGGHESEYNKYFASKICNVSDAQSEIKYKLDDTRLGSRSPYFVIAPGAGDAGRRWPAEKFAHLLSYVTTTYGLECIIIGGEQDWGLGATIKRAAPDMCNNLTGKTSLVESISIIARAAFVVSNESGPMHIGIWVETPTIGLIGGGHFGWFAPYPEASKFKKIFFPQYQRMPCYHCNWDCSLPKSISGSYPCVDDVATKSVIEAVTQIYRCAPW